MHWCVGVEAAAKNWQFNKKRYAGNSTKTGNSTKQQKLAIQRRWKFNKMGNSTKSGSSAKLEIQDCFSVSWQSPPTHSTNLEWPFLYTHYMCMLTSSEIVDCTALTNNMTTFHLYTITEDIQNWIQRFNKFNQSKVKYITSPSLRSTH